MCGIAGAFGERSRGGLREALRALDHRGPDGTGEWSSTDGVLLHSRLKIIDLSDDARQPLANEDGSVIVSFNGEIYNFSEHRSALEARGHTFRSRSDTEVIVHLYEELGEGCIEELDGMFAFGLWDARARRLLLARDRAGEKPLFYVANRDGCAFASTIRALAALGATDLAPEPASMTQLLAYGYVPPPATIYRDVRELEPGSCLSWTPGAAPSVRRYWSVSFDPAPRPDDFGRACANVRALLTRAVERRLVSEVPLGVFLSGGVDSTIITSIASKLRPGIQTFSVGFTGDDRFDERPYARLAAQHLRTAHTEFVVEPQAVELLDALVGEHEAPFGDSSALPTYLLAERTRQHVTVALGGDGGDEIFAGYHRFVAGVLAEKLPLWLRRILRRVVGRSPLSEAGGRGLLGRIRRFLGAADQTISERALRWQSYFAFDLEQILGVGFARPVDMAAVLDFHDRPFRGRASTPLAKLLRHNFDTYLPCDLLVKMDRMSMAHGLEVRSPFLDTALVEYVGALPDNHKLSLGRTKRVLRSAFAADIPRAIMTRPKAGFGVPLAAWFRGSLRDHVRSRLLDPEGPLRDWLDRRRVAWYVEEHMAGRFDFSHQIWLLLTMESWLRLSRSWRAGPMPAPVLA